VADERHEDALLVRARRRGDIEAVFPVAEVVETPDADYQFRTTLFREYVAGVIAKRLLFIQYPNFKNSIGWDGAGADRHDAYLAVWSTTRTRLTADPKPRRPRPNWLGGEEEGGDLALPFPPGPDEGGGGGSADFDPFDESEPEDPWWDELAARVEGAEAQRAAGEEEEGADAGPETMSEGDVPEARWLAEMDDRAEMARWLAEMEAV
jgi:hypothetical protein